MNLLDQIIEAAATPRILSEENNTANINVENMDTLVDASLRRPGGGGGGWDAAEYGISLEEAQRRFDEANTPAARQKVVEELRQRAIDRAGLDVSNGRVAVMVAGKAAWHKLGVNVESAVNSAQAIKLAGQDFKVLKVPATWEHGGLVRQSDETFLLIREDTGVQLGTVGNRYQAIQNIEAYEYLDSVLEQFGAKYETAGSLYGGRKVWMMAHLPQQSFTLPGNDHQEAYCLFTNPHDGSGRAFAYPTSERVVCANTLRMSTKDRGKGIGIRHTGNLRAKIHDAQTALGLAVKGFEQYKENAETLITKKVNPIYYANEVLDAVLEVTAAQAMKGADALAAAMQVTEANMELARKTLAKQIERREEILDDIIERYESARCGVNGMRGTAWSAFNAITEHADHNTIGRQKGSQANKLSRRMESAIAGEADDIKQVAYQTILQMAV